MAALDAARGVPEEGGVRALLVVLGALLPASALAQEAPPRLLTPPRLIAPAEVTLPPGTLYPAPEVAVVVSLSVTRTGTIARVELLEGAGPPFDEAALAAAERLAFEPARLEDGTQVPVIIKFRLTMRAPIVETQTVARPRQTYAALLVERGTRRPVADVLALAIEDGEVVDEARSDASGRLELRVYSSTFTLSLEPFAHAPIERPASIESSGERVLLDAIDNSYAVYVRGRRAKRAVAERVVSEQIVRRAAGTQGDALKVIQNLPGVARPAFGGGPLVLRGATPGDSRTFLEGQEIPQIFHFGGIRSTFASTFLESIELVPGNFGPEYGRAIGGVVDVRVRDPSKDLFRGEVDINLFDAGFTLEGPITDTLSIGGGFRRSYIDTILPAVIPDDAPLSFDVAPRYYDYQLIGAWKPSADHRARAFFYGALDRIELLFDDPATDPKVRGTLSARTMFHNLQLETEHRLSAATKLTTSIKLGTSELSFLLGPDLYFDLNVQNVSLRGELTVDLAERLELRLGTDSRVQAVQIGLAAPSPPKEGEAPVPVSVNELLAVTRDLGLVEPALYAELSWKPTDALELRPSVRVDFYSAIEEVTVDPRLAARLELTEEWAVRAGVGLHQQQPQYDESDATTGTPELLPPRSLQLSASVEHRPTSWMSVELTGFYKALDRVVTRGVGDGAPAFTNEATGRIFGLELLAKAEYPGVFTGWVTYTFQRSFRTDGPARDERVFDFDQPHILTALGTFELGSGWTAGFRFRLVSGNPYAPVQGSIYDAYADVYVPIFGPKTERLELFHQLDLRVDKTITFEEWKLELYLDVQNVYNHGNQEGWQYNYDYSEQQAVTGLPIVPIFGARGYW